MRRAASVALALAALAFAARCTLVTHAGDFRTAPDTRACRECPARPDLLHPPCAASGAPDGPGPRRIYALRSVDLGADRRAWNDTYWVGRDLDCSDRPAGLPVECGATSLPLPFGGAWAALPRGVDNALGAMTFAAMADQPRLPAAARDVQGAIDADLASGGWGMVLVVDGWSGQPDDASVTVTLMAARGIADPRASCAARPRTPAAWDGSDAWDVYPSSSVSGGTAYVVGGQLVWDAHAVTGASVHLENHGGVLDARLLDVVLVGAISPDKLSHLALSGRWPTANAHLTIGFLSGMDQATACAIHDADPRVTFQPPFAAVGPVVTDLAATRGAAPDAPMPCVAVSFGIGLEMERAASVADSPCPIPVPQAMPPTCPDAGAP